jgi:hypothetical protein
MAVVLIVPGGFALFLAYAFVRAVRENRRATAQANGGEAHLRDVLAKIRFKDLLRELRTPVPKRSSIPVAQARAPSAAMTRL